MFCQLDAMVDYFKEVAILVTCMLYEASKLGNLHFRLQLDSGGNLPFINNTYTGHLMRLCSLPSESFFLDSR